ncbi:MAG: 16S rRNA (uracil(1498)-N(3))-methyltransferase [Spirosomaceae bacterium]|jgi:16S rRNA (uracil1498-N3)-methyltransferase|nr:16S rRNA (uracil(1498)-N(3))-methyltransferase [Spirosomataceae bacterium]
MNLFYQKDFAHTHALTDDEAFHAAKVLRVREGDRLHVTDGQGNRFEGIVHQITPKRCALIHVTAQRAAPLSCQIEIALAPTKNIDRLEWFIEKATEMGISTVTLFYAEHSERRQVKLDRLEKIAISAMKQSLQAYLPVVQEVGDFKKWLLSQTTETALQRFIAHLPDGMPPPHLFQAATKQGRYRVLIGPEGDFSKDELQLAQELGYQNVVLGHTRLRTETAALVACQTLHILNY